MKHIIMALMIMVLASLLISAVPSTITVPVLGSTFPQKVTYYQSEWTAIQPGELLPFEHGFDELPSFTEIYIAARVNVFGEYSIAYPYHDYPVPCISIHVITYEQVIVSNSCDEEMVIRVGAVLYP